MPTIKTALLNTEDSIGRPVCLQVTRQIMDITHISNKTPIRYMGEEDRAAQANSLVLNEVGKDNIWAFDEYVTIEVTEEKDKDYLGQIQTFKPSSLLTFRDDVLGVGIKPIYERYDVTIVFKYTMSDRTKAKAWRNRIVANVPDQLLQNYHDISYHYEFRESLLQLIYHIWQLREAQGGYGDDFSQYLRSNMNPDMSVITDSGGKNNMVVIKENATRVIGYFDFDGIPDKAEKPNDGENREIGFTYKFMYDKPIGYMLTYPPFIHNQLIDDKYMPKKKIDILDKQLKYHLPDLSLRNFEVDEQIESMRLNFGKMIPWFDEFKPQSILPSSVKIFSALTQITPTDLKTLFNLSEEIGDYKINDSLLSFLIDSERNYVNRAFDSILSVELYKDNYYMGNNVITINPDGLIVANQDLDIRSKYNIRFSIITDLTLLSKAALERLRDQTDILALLITILNEALNAHGNAKDINKTRLLYKDYIALGYTPHQASKMCGYWTSKKTNHYGIDPDEFAEDLKYAELIRSSIMYTASTFFVNIIRPE